MSTDLRASQATLPADSTLTNKHRDPEPWSRLGLPDAEGLPSELIELGERVHEKHAIVASAFDPESFLRFIEFASPFLDPNQGVLPFAERELLGTVVSAENRCTGCLLSHTRKLGEAIGDELRAHRIAINYRHAHLSERERALADLAAKLTVSPFSVEDSDIARLQKVGLSDEAIHQAIVVIALVNYSNRISSGLGTHPDDDFFSSYQFGQD